MEKEEKEKTKVLPPIREDKEVKKGEPKITIGGKAAALPKPTWPAEA
jgi:hypothetical protein